MKQMKSYLVDFMRTNLTNPSLIHTRIHPNHEKFDKLGCGGYGILSYMLGCSKNARIKLLIV